MSEHSPLIPAHPAAAILQSPDTAALRAIAMFEAAKGLLVLAAGIGVLFFLHHNLEVMFVDVIRHMRIDPASRIPAFLMAMLRRAEAVNHHLVFAAAVVYALVRFTESYGLWFDRAWGEWIGALSGGIYLPFEAREAILRPSWWHAILLSANLVIVLFLVFHLWKRKHHVYQRIDEPRRPLLPKP